MGGQKKSSVGIPYCVTDGGEGPYSAALIDEVPRPFGKDIGCARCGVRVVAVGAHLVGSSLRRAHFRLGKGLEHDEGCQYDYERRMKAVADEHRAVVSADGDVCALRLNLEGPSGPTQTQPAPPGRKRRHLTVTASRTHGTVRQTVQAAASIARILRTFEHDSAAVERWRGIYEGRSIPWNRFHYRADEDYEQFAERLHARKPSHPLAVSGVVRRVDVREGLTSVHLETKPGALTPDGAYFNVVLRSRTEGVLPYAVGDEVLAYGMWSLWRPEPVEEERHRIVYATVWLANASQVALLDSP